MYNSESTQAQERNGLLRAAAAGGPGSLTNRTPT